MRALVKLAVLSVMTIMALGCASESGQTSAENKIVIWHWMTDRKDAFDALAKRYEQETGIKVESKLFFPADIYSSKVIIAGRAKNLPDIFGILGEKKTVASFIKAGHIENLNTVMDENNGAWKDTFYPKTLDVTVFKPGNIQDVEAGIYGVPVDTTVMQFVYNKALFKQAGLNVDEPPVTFGEFVKMATKIKNDLGVDGFVCGWGESWLLNALAVEWAINLMGEEGFEKTLKGEIAYTDKRWREVFSLFTKLRDSGFLAANIGTMTNKESEDAFSKDKAAFSFNGSWSVNVYKQKNPDLDYGFFSLPKISDDFPVTVWGGSGSSFMVNAKSANKQKAIKFLKWLTSKPQQEFLVQKTNNLPAIKGCEEMLPPILKSLLTSLANLTHPDTWPRNEDSRVLEIMNRGLQQIVMGIKKPDEVAREIQNVKERTK